MTEKQIRTLTYKIEDINARYDTEYDLTKFIRMTRKMNVLGEKEGVPYNLIFEEIEIIADTLRGKEEEFTF